MDQEEPVIIMPLAGNAWRSEEVKHTLIAQKLHFW
jgi:hypothetical protein